MGERGGVFWSGFDHRGVVDLSLEADLEIVDQNRGMG